MERHLYGGIRRLGPWLTGEYADYLVGNNAPLKNVPRGKKTAQRPSDAAPVFFARFFRRTPEMKHLQPNADEDDTAPAQRPCRARCRTLCRCRPAIQRKKVTTAMMPEAVSAISQPYPAMAADREGINAGGHALHKEGTGDQRGAFEPSRMPSISILSPI